MSLSTILVRCLAAGLVLLASAAAHAVVGGVKATPDAQPWLAAMLYTSVPADQACLDSGGSEVFCQQVCAASLIAPNWAITAAHCLIDRTNPVFIKLAVGNEDLNGTGITQLDVDAYHAVDGVPGPSTIYQDDLALLQLTNPVSGPFASLASVAEASELLALPDSDDRLEMMGWGQLDSGEFPSYLQRVRADLDQTNCGGLFVGVSMFCSWEATPERIEMDDAGDSSPLDATGEDVCILDSGGPLLYINGAGDRKLAGVVSWGVDSNCGSGSFGTAHTRIDYFLNWIESTSASAGLPMVDLAAEIVAPRSTTAASQSVRVYLRNSSSMRPINNTRLQIRYSGTGTLGSPTTSGLSCTASSGGDGYDCAPTLLPMAAGASPYVNLTASGLVDDNSLEIRAQVFRDSGEQDYRTLNDAPVHILSRTSKPDLVLTSPGASASYDADETSLWLFYQVANRSASIAATTPQLTLTLPAGWTLTNDSGLACSGTTTIQCGLASLSADTQVDIKLEFRGGSAGDFDVPASVSSSAGDFPTMRSGQVDTEVVTAVSFPTLSTPTDPPITEEPPPVPAAASSGSGGTAAWLLCLVLLAHFRSRLRAPAFRRPQ